MSYVHVLDSDQNGEGFRNERKAYPSLKVEPTHLFPGEVKRLVPKFHGIILLSHLKSAPVARQDARRLVRLNVCLGVPSLDCHPKLSYSKSHIRSMSFKSTPLVRVP